MKHHAERIRHLEQLGADLERQIADAQELQKGHRSQAQRSPQSGVAPAEARPSAARAVRRARKRR